MITETTADILRRRRGLTPQVVEPSQLLDVPNTPVPGFDDPERTIEVPIPGDVPTEQPQPPQAQPFTVNNEVAKTVTGAAPMPVTPSPDEDMWNAQEADRKSHLTAGLELAARQLVGGITRTDVPQGIGAAPSQVPAVQDRRKQALEVLQRQRQGRLDDSTLDLRRSEIDKNKADAAKSLREPVVKPVDPAVQPYRDAQTEHIKAETDALNRKPQELADKAARLRAAVEAKRKAAAAAEGMAAEGAKIPFAGGMFQPRAGVHVDRGIAKEASDKAALYSSAVAGIDDFMSALGEYAKHPGTETRDAVVAKANGVGGALNTAQGQGAMSEGEKREMSSALGVNVLSPAGIEAFAQSLLGDDKGAAAETITRRARAVRASMVQMAQGNLKSRNYDFVPGKAVEATPDAVKVIAGKRYVKRNGEWHEVQ